MTREERRVRRAVLLMGVKQGLSFRFVNNLLAAVGYDKVPESSWTQMTSTYLPAIESGAFTLEEMISNAKTWTDIKDKK